MFLRIGIAVDCLVLLVIFIKTQFDIVFLFPAPGKKLNNPLAGLLAALFLLGWVDPSFRGRWRSRLKTWVTRIPQRYYLFGVLLGIEAFLQIMWFLYPEDFLWNLNAEMGYGTHFSTVQLFLLGLIVLIVAQEPTLKLGEEKSRWPWYAVAGLFFYLALDDCVGIHENFIKWFQKTSPDAAVFHLIHEWLWFYGPFILAAVVFLARFFLKQFKAEPVVKLFLFAALFLWVSVIVWEGLAKNVVDPLGLDYSRLLIGIEEGSEMVGATLFLWEIGRAHV